MKPSPFSPRPSLRGLSSFFFKKVQQSGLPLCRIRAYCVTQGSGSWHRTCPMLVVLERVVNGTLGTSVQWRKNAQHLLGGALCRLAFPTVGLTGQLAILCPFSPIRKLRIMEIAQENAVW